MPNFPKPRRVNKKDIAYRLVYDDHHGYRLDISMILPPPKVENGGLRHVIVDEPHIKLEHNKVKVMGCGTHPVLSVKLVAQVPKVLEEKFLRLKALEKVRDGSPILV